MKPLSRRSFALLSGATLAGSATIANAQTGGEKPASGPVEAPFERDYDAPEFKPSWKKTANQSHARPRLRHLRTLRLG